MSPIRRVAAAAVLGLGLVAVAACSREESSGPPSPGGGPRRGISEVDPTALRFEPAAGQVLYVPAYSSISTSDTPHEFRLAITMTVRNIDRQEPLILKSVDYHDHDGQLVRSYLKTPMRVAPLASAEFFVGESDTSGGIAASFLVEWVAERPVAAPVVESVMIGTASTQGVSFTAPARVLSDLAASGPAAAAGATP